MFSQIEKRQVDLVHTEDLESVEKFIFQDCPYTLSDDAEIRINKKKIFGETSEYTGIIDDGNNIIKFSTEPGFLDEITKNRNLNKLFIRFNVRVRVPQLFSNKEGRISGKKILYLKSRKEKETDRKVHNKLHAKAIVKVLREFRKIPVEALEEISFITKTKKDYYNDIVGFFESIGDSLLATDTETRQMFAEAKQFALSMFAEDAKYEFSLGLTHSDFSRNNTMVDGAGRVKVIDWEDAVIGCPWEDFGRAFYDLVLHENPVHEHPLIEAADKKYPKIESKAKYFWDDLDSREKYHTMLFVIYKSLLLLNFHLEHYRKKRTTISEQKVLRNLNAFFIAVSYCRLNPDPQKQSTTYPFPDEVLASFFLNNHP